MKSASLFAIALLLTGCPAATKPGPASPPPPPVVESSEPAKPSELDATQESASTVTLEVADFEAYRKILESKRGKFVLVDFWATWCAPCLKGFPHTVGLHQKYGQQGVEVISFSMDEEDAHEQALEFLKQSQAVFTNLRSKQGAAEEAMLKFDIDGGALPHLRLYNREGELVKKFISTEDKLVEPQEVEAAVRELITRDGSQ